MWPIIYDSNFVNHIMKGLICDFLYMVSKLKLQFMPGSINY